MAPGGCCCRQLKDETRLPRCRKKKALKIGCLIAAGLGLLVCVAAFLFFKFGMRLLSDEVQREFKSHPVLLEHIGEIQSIELDWIGTGEQPGDDDFVYSLVGSKAKGQLLVNSTTNAIGTELFHSAKLQMEDGKHFDLMEPAIEEPD